MRTDIFSKLNKILRASIRNEPQVVYILTRIGKIIELEKERDKYPLLKFYRDWAVHTVLDS